MPMTMEQLKTQLSDIEPNARTFAGIGPSEIPLLEQLLHDEEPWMASRAVFALSRVPDARAATVVSQAVTDPRQEVRVAVAASAGGMEPQYASTILLRLLTDTELGVRKFAVQSVSAAHDAAVHSKLKEIEAQDPAPPIRDVAKSKLRQLKLVP